MYKMNLPPEYRLCFPLPGDGKKVPFAVDDCCLYKIRQGKVDFNVDYKTKEYVVGGKPTLFWMAGSGLRIPVAKTILTAWSGSLPSGCSPGYKDGNRLNCRLCNLEWKQKVNKSGNIVGISFDKAKNRYRVTRPGLKRSSHKTREEAIAAVLGQGATVDTADSDDEDEKTVVSEVSEVEEMSPEEKAQHQKWDAQFNKANGISE
jgi:hypothetical protein